MYLQISKKPVYFYEKQYIPYAKQGSVKKRDRIHMI